MTFDINSPAIHLFVLLTLAHVITDFMLQSNKWVNDKSILKVKSKFLYIHGLVTGIVAYALSGHWQMWWIVLFIGITHTLIDLWKTYQPSTLKYFALDQAAHIFMIVIATILASIQMEWYIPSFEHFMTTKFILILLGYLIVFWPAGYVINMATDKWRDDIPETAESESLDDAGKWIGILERALVLTFVLGNHFSAIGFLIAAKSILRFSEKQAVKRTEYVLIGTLLSFGIAIFVGLAMKNLMTFEL